MRIRCAKCGILVKSVEVERDIRYRSHVIVAHCHGEIDEMRIPYDDTASWTLADRQQWERVFAGEIEGIAFQEKSSLPAPVLQIGSGKGDET